MSTVASPSVPSDILARLRAFGNSQIASAEPSGGFRWPEPGNGEFLCRGATIKQETRKFGDASVGCVSFAFKWKWLDDPDADSPDDGLEFTGSRFQFIPKDVLLKLPETTRLALEGDVNRFAGFVKAILGDYSKSDEENIAAVYAAANNPSAPLVMRLNISKPNAKNYQKEYALEKMDSSTTTADGNIGG